MNFYADAGQDQFVGNLLKFKKDGYCVDIGSCHSAICNNTFVFQALGWTSVSVELDDKWNDSYSNRSQGTHYNEDALTIDYEKAFEENEFPTTIDYLSLDVDEISLDVLKILPLDKYRFKVITIEHDAYLFGDTYRAAQREVLEEKGYRLVCANVLVPQPNHEGYDGKSPCPFEDWWVHPDEFDAELLDTIQSDGAHPGNIILQLRDINS
jgi:hypothetical protein|tara:strand:- start:444 stop:1073 length:630 start_codon:yes stop_codon:yes gene_type:complete